MAKPSIITHKKIPVNFWIGHSGSKFVGANHPKYGEITVTYEFSVKSAVRKLQRKIKKTEKIWKTDSYKVEVEV